MHDAPCHLPRLGLAGLDINPDRPHNKLPYPGAWLWIGPEMIHLMELDNPDPMTGRPEVSIQGSMGILSKARIPYPSISGSPAAGVVPGRAQRTRVACACRAGVLPQHGGRDRHVCVGVTDIKPLVEKLDAHGVAYTMSKSGRPAVFFRDPGAPAQLALNGRSGWDNNRRSVRG